MLNNLKNFNPPEIEEKVLEYWKERRIMEKALNAGAESAGKSPKKKFFRFFEGPPSANGLPHIAHVLARSFKDIILRYKAMRGFSVVRKAGWDTHGLPIEIAVEKELGIKSKPEIEKFGVAEFNNLAKMLVWKYKGEWEKLTLRIGFWLDFKNPYITYDNAYIESLWWIFKRIHENGFLKKLYKVVAWCARCETPLSNHELGQPDVYRKVSDPSVYVKFKLKTKNSRLKTNEYLLVWTTTPWTLPANLAVAVDPKLTYTKFKVGNEYLWSFATPPLAANLEAAVVERLAGNKLVGLKYEPLYKTHDHKPTTHDHLVVSADFIDTKEGTGLVHIAPAFGEEDFKLWQSLAGEEILNIPVTIDDEGHVKKGLPGAGKFIKNADRDILQDLTKRGLIYHATTTKHDYPFCWRCSTPLIYFARLTWFIEMSRLRDQLLRANREINWQPEHVKAGRFGEWLREVKDWSIGRERYWGTPLPIWECVHCGREEVIGSFKELSSKVIKRNNFYFLRHGEAGHNISGIFAYQETAKTASKLTPLGIKQAKEAAAALKKRKIDLIFSSPLKRARETAEIVSQATGAKIIILEKLTELNPGIFQDQKIGSYHAFFKSELDRFAEAPAGAETLNDAKRRLVRCVTQINNEQSGKNILIVSHGDPLWLIRGASEGLSPEQFFDLPPAKLGELYDIRFGELPLDKDGNLNFHKPYVDELELKCGKCGKKMTRVKEVADVWFDSGAMPFAQWHYPFENKALIDKHEQFPADYISEGMDQTRGWFYTLLAIAVLLKQGVSYRNVISVGLVLDKFGQKMSKSKGNVVDPWTVIKKYGVDVLRWYFYTVNDPGDPKRFDEADLSKTMRKFHALFYNSLVFFLTYENGVHNGEAAKDKNFDLKKLSALDRWIIASWQKALGSATKNLEDYQVGQAARVLENFLDDLSHWYIRRSRRRFAEPSSQDDFQSANKTLRYVLTELAKAAAPFCPFLAEAVFLTLTPGAKRAGGSVHLETWPAIDKKLVDQGLLLQMAEIRRLASSALALRAEAGIRIRQPLKTVKLKTANFKLKTSEELLTMLKEEINVKEIIFGAKINSELELDTEITPELYAEGMIRELARTIQKLRQDAGFKVGDTVEIFLKAPEATLNIVKAKEDQLKKLVRARALNLHKSTDAVVFKADAQIETKLDEQAITVGVRKL